MHALSHILPFSLSSIHLAMFTFTHFTGVTLFSSTHLELNMVSLSEIRGYGGIKVKGLKLQLGRNRLGWAGAPRGVSDPLSWAPRAQQDQCVWIQASSAHNEGKWEFNTNFLTKSFRPPASVVVLTCTHPCLHHHHLHQCDNHNKCQKHQHILMGVLQ